MLKNFLVKKSKMLRIFVYKKVLRVQVLKSMDKSEKVWKVLTNLNEFGNPRPFRTTLNKLKQVWTSFEFLISLNKLEHC